MAAPESFRATKTAYVSLSVVFLLELLAASACAAAASASKDAGPKDPSDVLRQYEGKFVVLQDLDSEVVEHLRTTGGSETPGTVMADFDGDGVKDIALLTKEPDGTKLALRVFLCKSRCRQVRRVALGDFEGLQYLTPIPRGTAVKAAESLAKSSQEASLRHTGIKYWVFGRANVVYFWDRKSGKVTSVTAGD